MLAGMLCDGRTELRWGFCAVLMYATAVCCCVQRRAVGLGVSDHKLQEKLRIVSGSAAGRKLVSFRSPQTRPMMEKVWLLGCISLGSCWLVGCSSALRTWSSLASPP